MSTAPDGSMKPPKVMNLMTEKVFAETLGMGAAADGSYPILEELIQAGIPHICLGEEQTLRSAASGVGIPVRLFDLNAAVEWILSQEKFLRGEFQPNPLNPVQGTLPLKCPEDMLPPPMSEDDLKDLLDDGGPHSEDEDDGS